MTATWGGDGHMAKEYERIAAVLRDEIRDCTWSPGGRLPAEASLATRFSRGLPTVRQALGALQAEGLIEKRHGRGNFVRQPRQLVQRRNDRHQWEKNRARAGEDERRSTGATERDTGLDVNDLVFSAKYEEMEATADDIAALGLAPGDHVLERTYRTRYRREEAPFNLTRSRLPLRVVMANPALRAPEREPWPGGTQAQLHAVGIEVDSVTEHVTARPPTHEEAEELALTSGVAILALRKVCRSTDGVIVEVADVVLPGDRTELVFTTPLERW